MICPRCGNAMPDGVKFCGACGLDFMASDNTSGFEPQGSSPEPKSMWGRFKAAVGGAIEEGVQNATFCKRCGYKTSLFGRVAIRDGILCKDCLNELGMPEKDPLVSKNATYEMVLLGARSKNPSVLNAPIGLRQGEEFIQPAQIPYVRSAQQILDGDFLVQRTKLKLGKTDKCYYTGTVSYEWVDKVVKGGGTYTSVSIPIGGGFRYRVGGKTPVKTKDVKKTERVDFYLTSDSIILVIKEKPLFFPYYDVQDITWSPSSFEVTAGYETAKFGSTDVDRIRMIYTLIMLAEEESKVRMAEQLKIQQEKKTRTRKKAAKEAPAKDPVAQIREYKQLMDDGIITEEEFEKKKSELLGL